MLTFVATQAVILLAWTGFSSGIHGSSEVAIASLRGDEVVVQPGQVNFGTGGASEPLPGSVTVHNLSAGPVTLLGGTSDCSCVTTADMPVTIPSGASRSVGITIKLPPEGGAFRREAYFWTDHPVNKTLVVELSGRAYRQAE